MDHKIIYRIVYLWITLFCLFGSTNSSYASEKDRRKFDYYFYEALNAKALGDYDRAMDLLKYCHSLDSTNSNVLIELGVLYNVLQEKDLSLEYLKSAVKNDSTNFYYNMMLAGLSRELGLKQDLVDIYERMLELYPDRTDVYFQLANAYADNGELEKAIDALNELEKSFGVSETLALSKFRLFSMLDDRDRAYDEIRQIIDKNPTDVRYMILMGDLYLEDNEQEKALDYYKMAEAVDASFPALILSMVKYYEKLGDSDSAYEELNKAIANSEIEVESKLQLLTSYLGMLYKNKQDLNKALPLFDYMFEQYPNYSELNMLYGGFLEQQEKNDGAIEQYRKYIDSNPNSPEGYEQIIRIALRSEDYKMVETISTEAIRNVPNEPQFYYYLGAVYYQSNDYKKALKTFEEGLENSTFRNPALESDFYGQVGDLNHVLGNDEKAFENYEKALDLNPQNLMVLNNFSYYLSVLGSDLDKAERMSSITIKAEPMNSTFLDTYGWVLYKQESYVMAKIYIEKAIEYEEDEPSAEVHEHYGDVLYKLGEKDKALEEWKRAKELGGDSKALNKKIRTKKMKD